MVSYAELSCLFNHLSVQHASSHTSAHDRAWRSGDRGEHRVRRRDDALAGMCREVGGVQRRVEATLKRRLHIRQREQIVGCLKACA